ncbi:MAG: hypothetical protein WAO71_10435 [Gallionella sp.]
MFKKMIYCIFGLILVTIPVVSCAESLGDFLQRALVSNIDRNDFHEEAKYLVRFSESEGEQPLTYPQLVSYFSISKLLITKAEIIHFSILSEFENNGVVSVVSKSRVRITMGAGVVIGESVSHDILRRENDSFVSVFNYTQQKSTN